MSWSDRIQSLKKQPSESVQGRMRATNIQSVGDIPTDATYRQVFRLNVEVRKITERETRNGDPCYFLDLQDVDGVRFPAVVWDWQWAKFRGTVVEGRSVELDVCVPKDGYHAFSLA